MMTRNKVARKRLIDQIEAINKKLIRALNADDDDDAMKCRNELQGLTSQSSGSVGELKDLQVVHDKLLAQLDTTRAQRMKNDGSARYRWSDELDTWMDRRKRRDKAKIDAIMKEALKKETERLSEYHTYDDNSVDQPLLNIDTIKDDNMAKDY